MLVCVPERYTTLLSLSRLPPPSLPPPFPSLFLSYAFSNHLSCVGQAREKITLGLELFTSLLDIMMFTVLDVAVTMEDLTETKSTHLA